ncbi:ER degradation-enhancing alpha-mannosidase-like protein 2 [Anabrus simplex]|uniref:ER degradation-enhancing alpha-mannosidase-like protein 2 n=1 Tax=Anabrus simplex TaxID=316456 RepID=UPI0034DDA1E2
MAIFTYITFAAAMCMLSADISSALKYTKKDLENLREEVRQMFQHAYDSYLKYAYPYDELRPLSCDGVDTWGSYSLTLIDALDTLAVMGNYTEFQRVVDIITTHANFDANINVSVFETNIRIIGGLLSAHLLSYRAGVAVEPGWPCNGPLLQLAEDVARRLLAAFDSATGMPYGTVNLRHGVPEGETSITCTAGVGTFILELGTLSRLTGDPLFEEVAMNALYALYAHRSPIGLVGNHVDVQTGRWTAQDAGIGAGVDSYYEYLAKGAILLQRPELMRMFHEGRAAIDRYLKRDDWHLWVSMSKGQVTLPVFQSLEAYWPGVLSLIGDINKGVKSLHNYHQVWKQYGFTPEFYNIPQGEVGANREGYPLRPELIESVMYLYRATGDPYLLEVGKDILRSIQHSARTPCGYATIKDVRDHRKEDRMESFFLAETTKYLYLLFDPGNFIHNRGQHGTVIQTPWGECVLEAGGYIFNTEAHPIDPGALHCCSGHRQVDIQQMFNSKGAFQGDPLSTRRRQRQGAPPRPVPDDPVVEEIVAEDDYPSPTDSTEKRKAFLNKLADEIDGAIDVIRPSNQEMEDDKTENAPNISYLDASTDLPLKLDLLVDKKVENGSKSEDDRTLKTGKSDALEYRADDSDRVYSVSDKDDLEVLVNEDANPDVVHDSTSDNSKSTEDEAPEPEPWLPRMSTSNARFDPQTLLERLRAESRYKRNISWELDYQLLSCPAQPFLQRLSMSGEIFGVS